MRLAAALPYFNRHICDILERVSALDGQSCSYLVWQDMPDFRKGNDWVQPQTAKRISNWTGPISKHAVEWLKDGECFFFLGFFDPFPAMPWLIHQALRTGKEVYVATEGLKQPNYVSLRRFVLQQFGGHPNGRLLAIGSGCAEDFWNFGLTWPAFCFGYSESPLPGAGVLPRDRVPGQALRLLAVGQLIPRKRYDWLIRLVANLSMTMPVELRICGEGEQGDALRELAAAMCAPVHFMGFRAGEALAEQYAWADVFVHPAEYEGWGVVLNHALSFGLPIVAGEKVRSANGILVRDGWNGFVCSTESDYSMALRRFSAEPDLLKRCRGNSAELGKKWSGVEIAYRLAHKFHNLDNSYPYNEPLAKLST